MITAKFFAEPINPEAPLEEAFGRARLALVEHVARGAGFRVARGEVNRRRAGDAEAVLEMVAVEVPEARGLKELFRLLPARDTGLPHFDVDTHEEHRAVSELLGGAIAWSLRPGICCEACEGD